jgi:hypothetical protein
MTTKPSHKPALLAWAVFPAGGRLSSSTGKCLNERADRHAEGFRAEIIKAEGMDRRRAQEAFGDDRSAVRGGGKRRCVRPEYRLGKAHGARSTVCPEEVTGPDLESAMIAVSATSLARSSSIR